MIKSVVKNFNLSVAGVGEFPCSLPCSASAVLKENKIIPDPYYRDNIARLSEISGDLSFSTVLTLGETVASMRYVYVKLSGVCADAEFFFNGRSFGFMKNPNVEHTFNVTDAVKVGENTISIKIISGEKRTRYLSPSSSASDNSLRFSDAGILGRCVLHASNHPLIDSISLNQRHEGGKVMLDISVDTLSDDKDLRAVATLVSPVGRLYFAGITNSAGTVIVSEPELWWPNGMGKASLYKLTVTLYSHDEATDSKEIHIGLRDVKHENGHLIVNGKQVMVKGTEYETGADVKRAPSAAEYEKEIKAISAASINMLSISALGAQPGDDFYRLCDKYGIIVFQGIPVPYTKSSSISSFTASFKKEFSSVLARLSLHPSVCGVVVSPVSSALAESNSENEIEEFLQICRRTAQPISDKYSEFVTLFDGVSGVIPGIISLPSIKTIKSFAGDGDLNLTSPVMELHTPSSSAATEMLVHLHSKMRYATSLEKLIYSSELASAEHMREAVERARREKDEPFVIAARYNDSWPSLSPSFTDYFGRKKALYYFARRFFASASVSAEVEGTVVSWHAVNDSQEEYVGSISYALYNSSDKCIFESKCDLRVPVGERALVLSEDFGKYINGKCAEHYVIYDVFDGVKTTSKRTVHFMPLKAYPFAEPQIDVEITGAQRKYEIALSSRAYAASVLVDFEDVDADFSDNFVDITPDYPIKLSFVTDRVTTAEHLRSSVKLTSAYDLIK